MLQSHTYLTSSSSYSEHSTIPEGLHFSRLTDSAATRRDLEGTSLQKIVPSRTTSNEQFVFLLYGRITCRRRGGAPRAQHIKPNFDSLHKRGGFVHRTPETPAYLRAGIFN